MELSRPWVTKVIIVVYWIGSCQNVSEVVSVVQQTSQRTACTVWPAIEM